MLGSTAAKADAVNVYSYRQPFLVKPLFDKFKAETGTKVNVLFAKKGLVERLKAEGRNSPADLIFTVDIGRLNDVKLAGVTQPVSSETLTKIIPAQYRDPAGDWFALTTRARVIYAAKGRVEEWKSLTYESLADPKFNDRICTRSGKHAYTIALVASMIAHHGHDAAETWLTGVKNNLARRPQGNDRAQVKAIKDGLCDIALGNNYYFGKMMDDPKQRPWAESVHVVFPNQADRGAHVNISGMALAKHAPNPRSAQKLMEWLVGPEAQSIYAEQNYEYPIREGVKWAPLLADLGTFKSDALPISKIAELRKQAVKLVDEVGFDG
jgi:iron(III) transport system substrate-binding protein